MASEPVRYGTPAGRWVLTATVLGSGVAFLDGSVVNVALPAIGEDLDISVSGLQWTVDAYLVTLSALLLLGGSLGDRYGRRRVFVAGLATFSAASVLCAVAPSAGLLIAARAAQGVGGALLVPGSLAIIAATFTAEDRGKAIGAWSGLAGVAGALGPFVGGSLIDAGNWRLIFLINLPIAAVAALAARHVPETRSGDDAPIDVPGGLLVTVALATLTYGAIEHRGADSVVAAGVGLLAGVGFVRREQTASHPMLPLGLFRSPQFLGANLTTLAVYGALSAAFFLIVLRLQVSLGYSALEAGAALVPFTGLMLLLSPLAGHLGQRVGARIPMTVGPLTAGGGLLLLSRAGAGDTYPAGVLPGIVLFGMGMSLTVAPLTAAVLGGVADAMVGVASGVNNAVARLAGAVAVAVVPAVAGVHTGGSLAAGLDAGYSTTLVISAVLCALGGAVAWAMVRTTAATASPVHPAPTAACHHPAVSARRGEAA
jgi:EmrB/QacA subfamily drug resistance transporter